VTRGRAVGVLAAAAALLAAVLGVRVLVAPALPDAPVPVPFDRAACAGCRMLVSEPAFAVQVHRDDGQVLFFDDPGEALLWLAAPPAGVHAAWFHHAHEDRWVAREAVAFARMSPTPMGYGLGAVDAGEPQALSPAAATEAARAVERDRGGGP
jgi:hypothetical protein